VRQRAEINHSPRTRQRSRPVNCIARQFAGIVPTS
jgi:hypothetical protein